MLGANGRGHEACVGQLVGFSLVKANREVYPEYWEMALKESLSHTERILFDQILWKIDSHRDNALAHSNAEYLNATDMGFVATVSINGAMKFSLEEIKVWAMLTDKIIGGIMIVHDKIREQETTQYPPFLIAGKMIEVKENPVDE